MPMPPIEVLVGALSGPRPDGRKDAAEAIAALPPGPAREAGRAALLTHLSHPLRDVRIACADALAAFPDAEVVSALVGSLEQDDYPNVRQVAARSLGQIGDHAALPALMDAIGSGHPSIVRAAAKALGRCGDPRAVPLLLPLTHSSDPPMAQVALDALVGAGGAAPSPEIIDALHAGLRHASWLVRQAAANGLVTLRLRGSLDALKAALALESHPVARALLWQAVEALEHEAE